MRCILTLLIGAVLTTPCDAGLVDLAGRAADFDNLSTATITVDGVAITFTTNIGTLNSNAPGASVNQFGINGPGSDDADAIEGTETLTVSFDTLVSFDQVDLNDFTNITGPPDSMLLKIGSNAELTLSNSDSSDVFDFTTENLVQIGESITFKASVGDFALRSFTFTAVPEPTSAAYGLLFAVAGITRRRKRR